MKGAPRSEQFDDVYFSAEDGLAETRHVFLAGNGLPEAWQGREDFTICELGFGTGLNFLASWKLFEETAQPAQRLHFISIEKYPLSGEQIDDALIHWDNPKNTVDTITPHRIALCKIYQEGGGVFNLAERVRLTLVIGDVNEALPQLDAHVDCWFLDGFKPSSNPEMWSNIVFENMARLSKSRASFATFTAAGFVRRGLQEAGFDVRKVPGFGRKRDMLVGFKP